MPVDPVSLEVFKNMFESVAEEMGVALQRTSIRPTSRSAATSPAPCSIPRAT